jgi:hypothetical protein
MAGWIRILPPYLYKSVIIYLKINGEFFPYDIPTIRELGLEIRLIARYYIRNGYIYSGYIVKGKYDR